MTDRTLVLDAFWTSNHAFPTKLSPNSIEGKAFYSNYTGNKHNLGWMDLLLLKKIIKERHISHIALQNLDTLGRIAEITLSVQVCVAYEYKNVFIIPSIESDTNFKKCKPIYKTVVFGGWNLSENDAIIPGRAKRYIKFLLIETQVESITCQTNRVKLTAHFDSEKHVVFDTEAITK